MRSDRERVALHRRLGAPETSALLRLCRALGSTALILSAAAMGCATEPETIRLLDTPDASATSATCRSDGDCSTNLPRCNKSTHHCVECISAAECPANMSCSASTNSCVSQCASAADCSGIDRDVCGLDGSCVQCASDFDCASAAGGPRCNLRTGVCVQCVLDIDCNPRPCFDDCLACVNNTCTWRT